MGEYFEFEVSLKDVKPKIWRRFLLPKTATFLHLHDAIQVACGWGNCHLYSFSTKERVREEIASTPCATNDYETSPPSNKVKLAQYFEIYSACNYTYDFGDHWDHEVKLKKIVLDSAKFKRKILDGKRAFPLDDCGGVPGYFDCADLITGVTKGNKELKEWIGKDWHPEKFDLEEMKKLFNQ